MNHPGAAGRPPSYTNNYAPAPAGVGRTTSPMATGNPRTPPSQMMGGPPPINTSAPGYPPGHPAAGGMGAPPPAGGPPQYGGGPPQYGAPGAPVGGQSIAAAQYANRGAVEVEGAGRSKAQLIVGIDFVSLLSRNVKVPSNFDRELHSRVLHSHLRPTRKQKKISLQSGLVLDHIPNRR